MCPRARVSHRHKIYGKPRKVKIKLSLKIFHLKISHKRTYCNHYCGKNNVILVGFDVEQVQKSFCSNFNRGNYKILVNDVEMTSQNFHRFFDRVNKTATLLGYYSTKQLSHN